MKELDNNNPGEDLIHEQEISDLIYDTKGVKSKLDALSLVFDAVESTVGGVLITDLKGIITYVNPSFLKMFEYPTKKEVIGLDSSIFFRSKTINSLLDVLSLVNLAKGETEEFVVTHKDGSLFFVEVSVSYVRKKNGTSVGLIASFVDITRRKVAEEKTEKLLFKLQNALKKIEVLQGMIPICSNCKKIRDDNGYWRQLEEYLHEHSGTVFSHGMCDECEQKLYGNEKWYKKHKSPQNLD